MLRLDHTARLFLQRSTSIFWLAVASAVTAPQLYGQAPREIQPGPSCPTCEITIQHMTTIGASGSSAVAVSPMTKVAALGDGRYVVAPTYNPGEVVIVDSQGRVVARTERPGRGPGEFVEISRVVVSPTDSVLLFDPALSRVSVLSNDLEFARSVPWFTAWTAYEPPIPTLRSIRQDADGLLWVLINVPDSRYRQPTVPPAVDDVSVWDLRSDTMIEVIDPGRAIVVAQRRFDPLFTQFVGPLVYAHREGADGEIVVDVYRLSLQR